MEINFKANLINKTCVRKFSPTAKNFVPYEVSFAEINPYSRKDLKALKKLTKTWGDKSYYAKTIYSLNKSNPNLKTYVLTEQETDFKKLDPKKILGIAQMRKESSDLYCIDFLETKPELQKTNKERNYKRIGSRMLHCFKKTFFDKTLKVDYIFDEIQFYINNGFYFNDPVLMELIWKLQKRK